MNNESSKNSDKKIRYYIHILIYIFSYYTVPIRKYNVYLIYLQTKITKLYVKSCRENMENIALYIYLAKSKDK